MIGEVMGQAGYWNFPNLFLQDLQVANYFAADFLWFSEIVVQHLLDHDHAKSAKSRNIGQPQGGKKLLKQKSTWICSMKIPKSWGLRDHARVRRLIHRCLEERPGRYVPLESTWWGFRMFQTLPGFLWYPLIVWLRMNGMPMNQQFLGHLSCRLHIDLVDLMPEITGCTMSACRVPVKC